MAASGFDGGAAVVTICNLDVSSSRCVINREEANGVAGAKALHDDAIDRSRRIAAMSLIV